MKNRIIAIVLLCSLLFSFVSPAYAEDTLTTDYLSQYGRGVVNLSVADYYNNIIPFYDSVKTYNDDVSIVNFSTWFNISSFDELIELYPDDTLVERYNLYSHVFCYPVVGSDPSLRIFFFDGSIEHYMEYKNMLGYRWVESRLKISEGSYTYSTLTFNSDGLPVWSHYSDSYISSSTSFLLASVMYSPKSVSSSYPERLYQPDYWNRDIFDPYYAYYYYFCDQDIYNEYGDLISNSNIPSGGSDSNFSDKLTDIKNDIIASLGDHPYLQKLLELFGLTTDSVLGDDFGGGSTRGGGAGRENIADIDVDANNDDRLEVGTVTETVVDETTGETVEITVVDDTDSVNLLRAIYNKLSDIYYFLVNIDFSTYFSTTVPSEDGEGSSLSFLDYIKLAIVSMTDILGSLLQGVIDAIGVLATGIVDALAQIPTAVVDLLTALLIPDEEELQSLWDNLNDTFNSHFGDTTFDLSPMLGDEAAPSDIVAASTYNSENVLPEGVSFVNWTWFYDAVDYFRPYIQAVIIVLLMLFHFNQILHFMGVAPISISGRQSNGKKD